MRLLFNIQRTQPLPSAKYHGGGKYGLAVFKRLLELNPNKLSVYMDSSAYTEEWVKKAILEHDLPVYYKGKINMFEAARKEGGVLVDPNPRHSDDSFPPQDITMIYTEHDLRDVQIEPDNMVIANDSRPFAKQRYYYHKLKDLFFREKEKNTQSFLNAVYRFFKADNTRVVTVSEHSKYSFLEFFTDIDADDIKVFWSPSTIDKSLTLEGYENNFGKYWLITSANRWQKNAPRAMLAFDEIFTERPNIEGKVIITGVSKWEEFNIDIKNKSRFILLGYVDELTLKGLYHYAYLFIYPTLNEGFGYPPVEAMHEGCPVICSAISSTTEICGDGAMYFSPFRIGEIKNRILQMENKKIRDVYVEQAKRRVSYIEQKQENDLNELCEYILSYVQ